MSRKLVADDVKVALHELGFDATDPQCKEVVGAVLDSILEQVKKGDKCSLFRFGSFEARDQAARKMRNPQTGGTIDVPAKKVFKFKVSSWVKTAINE